MRCTENVDDRSIATVDLDLVLFNEPDSIDALAVETPPAVVVLPNQDMFTECSIKCRTLLCKGGANKLPNGLYVAFARPNAARKRGGREGGRDASPSGGTLLGGLRPADRRLMIADSVLHYPSAGWSRALWSNHPSLRVCLTFSPTKKGV